VWGYRIERADGTYVGTTTSTSYNLTGLFSNTDYSFRVIAQYNPSQTHPRNSLPSTTVTFRTTGTITPPGHTITFDFGNGQPNATRNPANNTTWLAFRSAGNVPTLNAFPGFVFRGWYNTPAGTDGINVNGMQGNITGNHTFYARWASEVGLIADTRNTITFNPNGGNWNGSTANQTRSVPHNMSWARFHDWNNLAGIPSPPTFRFDYTFDGWFTSAGVSINSMTTGNIARNYTFFSRWTPLPERTIAFNPNGGNWNGNTDSVTRTARFGMTWSEFRGQSSTLIGPPRNPTRDGFNFVGWYNTSAIIHGQNLNGIPGSSIIVGRYTFHARWRLHAPRNVRPTSIRFNSVELEWDAVPGAWGYRIEHADGRYVATVRTTSHTVRNLTPDTRYSFRVFAQYNQAFSDPRTSLPSVQISVRTLVEPRVELIPNPQQFRREFGYGRRTVPLTDLWTGLTFNISWQPPWGYGGIGCTGHTDWNPVDECATETFRQIVELATTGGREPINWNNSVQPSPSWLWEARPGVIEVDGRRIAVGFHLFPHERIMSGNPTWPFVCRYRCPIRPWLVGGHMCMYYGNLDGREGAPGAHEMAREAQRIANSPR